MTKTYYHIIPFHTCFFFFIDNILCFEVFLFRQIIHKCAAAADMRPDTFLCVCLCVFVVYVHVVVWRSHFGVADPLFCVVLRATSFLLSPPARAFCTARAR